MMVRPFPGPLFPAAALLLVAAAAAPVAAVLAAMSPHDAFAGFTAGAQDALRVSASASLGATAVATLLGVPAGYYLARAPRALQALAVFALALPLAFPPVASGLMLLNLLGTRAPLGAFLAAHGLTVPDSLLGVAAAEFFVSGSFIAIAATAAFAASDPIVEDAARTLGASEWRIFTRIALPNAAGSLAAGIAFAWLRAIGEYGATSIVAFHPTSLPVALYVALSASGVRAALALCYGFIVLVAAVLAAAWILRRRVVW
ncbi:MAG: ABC transporter permease subunit [Candidatus Eremiobacteraeota bacterium]|nr:ABC transporter permease subunit [Candidatus Eremiobacteraeota bacterium]MBV8720584.1 ABC transporter permease subunit [Candidatus Eremiobacteraeota bacterium]